MRFVIPEGEVCVTERGLYWMVTATCRAEGTTAPRLYCNGRAFGRFVPESGVWTLRRQVSKREWPLDAAARFSLEPDSTPPTEIPYEEGKPLPEMERFLELEPFFRDGRLWIRKSGT